MMTQTNPKTLYITTLDSLRKYWKPRREKQIEAYKVYCGECQNDGVEAVSLEDWLKEDPKRLISLEEKDDQGVVTKVVVEKCLKDRLEEDDFLYLDGVDFRSIHDHSLVGANFQNISLRGSNFYDIILDEADFSGAKLQGANLAACLEGAIFNGADLSGADLDGARLDGAKLEGAILKGANLKKAILEDAVLDDADLSGADLSGADLRRASFSRTKMKGAKTDRATVDAGILKAACMDPDSPLAKKIRAEILADWQRLGMSLTPGELQEYGFLMEGHSQQQPDGKQGSVPAPVAESTVPESTSRRADAIKR